MLNHRSDRFCFQVCLFVVASRLFESKKVISFLIKDLQCPCSKFCFQKRLKILSCGIIKSRPEDYMKLTISSVPVSFKTVSTGWTKNWKSRENRVSNKKVLSICLMRATEMTRRSICDNASVFISASQIDFEFRWETVARIVAMFFNAPNSNSEMAR